MLFTLGVRQLFARHLLLDESKRRGCMARRKINSAENYCNEGQELINQQTGLEGSEDGRNRATYARCL